MNDTTGKLVFFDPAEGLMSNEVIAAFMAQSFASKDAGHIIHALSVVIRSKG